MRIDEITLKNFKCFEDESFVLHPLMNLIIGENGKGKTAILDAIAIGLGCLFSGVEGIPERLIREQDIRRVPTDMGSMPNSEPQFPVQARYRGEVNHIVMEWARTKGGSTGRLDRSGIRSVKEQAQRLHEGVQAGMNVVLPVIAYYGTGRLWDIRVKPERKLKLKKVHSRLDGYRDCLDPSSNRKQINDWFYQMTLTELQSGIEMPELNAIRKILSSFVETEFKAQFETEEIRTAIRFDLASLELVVDVYEARQKQDVLLACWRFHELSDGYQNLLYMVADIAKRMAQLNPHLSESLAETPGVILVDEIDLHLHPRWQRHVLFDFSRTFPNVQFVMTTHSPTMIQSCKKEHLMVLGAHQNPSFHPYTQGRGVESILQEIMGVSPRQLEYEERISSILELLDHRAFDVAAQRTRELAALWGDADPEIVRLRTHYDFMKMLEEDGEWKESRSAESRRL